MTNVSGINDTTRLASHLHAVLLTPLIIFNNACGVNDTATSFPLFRTRIIFLARVGAAVKYINYWNFELYPQKERSHFAFPEPNPEVIKIMQIRQYCSLQTN
jgi:hypothetical protein